MQADSIKLLMDSEAVGGDPEVFVGSLNKRGTYLWPRLMKTLILGGSQKVLLNN